MLWGNPINYLQQCCRLLNRKVAAVVPYYGIEMITLEGDSTRVLIYIFRNGSIVLLNN
jgi:hypothetical protein